MKWEKVKLIINETILELLYLVYCLLKCVMPNKQTTFAEKSYIRLYHNTYIL